MSERGGCGAGKRLARARRPLRMEQVREELKATDSWGRSVIMHAILSGDKQVFEVTMDCIRQRVLAEEVS